MYSLQLTPEQIEFRDTVRGFVNDEVKPVALKADRLDLDDRSLPVEVLRKASQLGLRTLALPEELGGVGADALTCCLVIEELAAGDADVAAVLAHTSELARTLFPAMTRLQRDQFLPRFLDDDDCHLAVANHETGADTALGINYHRPITSGPPITTAVVRDGGSVVINGTKDRVANGPVAKLFAVEAMTERGPALILVPRDTAGLVVTETVNPRWHLGASATVTLNDCRVPAGYLLSAGGAGGIGHASPLLQALSLGIGRAAFEAAVTYAQLRVQGGRPIAEHQAIATKLADIAIRLEAARNLVWQAAWASDHPEGLNGRDHAGLPLAMISEAYTSEAIHRVTKDAAECFGAMGVMRDMPMQKYIHDALVCLHSGDGNADARLRIAEAILNYRRPAAPLLAAE